MGPPLSRGKHVCVDLCTPDGVLERRFIGKSQGVGGGYWFDRKLRWGDITYYTTPKKGIGLRFRHGE